MILGISNSNAYIQHQGSESHPNPKGFGLLPRTTRSHRRVAGGSTMTEYHTPMGDMVPTSSRDHRGRVVIGSHHQGGIHHQDDAGEHEA